MKITALETIQLGDYPNLAWLRIHTDEGITGLGEAWRGTDAVASYIHSMVAPYLLGASPLEIDKHSKYLLNPIVGFNSASAEVRAASAVDIALWDIFGKVVDQPLYQLLGGLSRNSIRVYNTCAGYNFNNKTTDRRLFAKGETSGDIGPYEDQTAFADRADELAHSLISEGYSAMKIWPFDKLAAKSGGQVITAEELKIGLEPFEKIRRAVGGKIEIMCEMHSLWNYPSALRIAKALEPYDIFWFEDPMKVDNPRALAQLAANTTIPICASETVATRATFRDLFIANACSYTMVDIGWCGGISEARKIATMSEAFQLPISPHDCTGPVGLVAGTHLSLNAPNAIFQEMVRAYVWGYYRELLTELPRIENGHAFPMTGAGLGTELQPGVFKRDDVVIRKTSL